MIVMETPRILMRTFVESDLDDLARLYANPDVRRHFPSGSLSRSQTEEELAWLMSGGHAEVSLWAAIERATGRFIGRGGFVKWTIEGVEETEIAYMVEQALWRQGFGSEMAQALVKHGITRLGRRRLIALIAPANIASQRTASKAGLAFEREALVDDYPCQIWAISA